MELEESIKLRRSYRNYLAKDISKEDLDKILNAGMKAPVAVGRYENTKLVVLEKESLEELRKKLIEVMHKDPTYGCNKLVLIYSKNPNNDLANLDAGCIGENMMLEATSLNIQSVMIYCIKPFFNSSELLKEYASIDDEYKFMVSIALGYKADDVLRDVSHKIDVISK